MSVLLAGLVARGSEAGQSKEAPPPAPTGLWAAQTSPTEITLAWGRATTPSPAVQVKTTTVTATTTTTYRVYRERPDGSRQPVTQLSGSATVAVVPVRSGDFGTAQQYVIEAVAGGGSASEKSAASQPVRFNPVTPFNPVTAQQTTAAAIPAAPASVTATQTGETEITVTWTEVPDATAYRIGRSVSPSGFQTFCQICPTGSTIVDHQATGAGAQYKYIVAAYTPRGTSKQTTSNPVTLTPKSLVASGAGTSKGALLVARDLWAAQTSRDQITLVWRAPEPNPALKIGPVSEYRVYEESDGRTRLIATLGATATRAVVPADAAAGRAKQFSIAAASTTIKASPEDAVKFNVVTPTAGERPGSPSPVAVSRTGGGQNTVTWTPVPGATAYRISRSLGTAGLQSLCDVCPTSTTFVDNDAAVPTAYRYVVSAYSAGGEGIRGESPVLDLRQSTTDPKGTLKAPTNAKALATSPTSVTVTWGAAEGATGYRVRRSLNAGTFVLLATLPATEMRYQDTAPNLLQQAPRYRIEALDANGRLESVSVTVDSKTAVQP